MKRLAVALALAFSPALVHADDSLFVHDLAHYAGGVMVASATDCLPIREPYKKWFAYVAAVGVDEFYEAATNKSAGLSWQHNAWALGGAVTVCVQW